MKRSGLCLMLVLAVGGTGCSNRSWDWNWQPNWDTAAPQIERFVELSARIAFERDDVKPYKPKICEAADMTAGLLLDYENPDATFEEMRSLIIGVLDRVEMDPEVRQIASLVLNQILDVAFMYARDSYLDLINKDENKAALIVSKAIATGLNNACSERSLNSFQVKLTDTLRFCQGDEFFANKMGFDVPSTPVGEAQGTILSGALKNIEETPESE